MAAMTVLPYKQTDRIIVEGDCTRLSCGHAYHTTCLVTSLVSCKGKCALCNISNIDYDEDMLAEERLRLDALCLNKLEKVKNTPVMKNTIKEFVTLKRGLLKQRSIFKAKVKAYKKQLRDEMDIDNSIKKLSKSRNDVLRNFKKEVNKTKGVENAALMRVSPWRMARWLFGDNMLSHVQLISRSSHCGFY